MVARIRSGKTLKGAINYNEKKVSEGRATLIEAKFYPKAHDKLNFHEKLNRLQNLANLNTRTTTNCLHLSLNFDPSENLSSEKLKKIAEDYMRGINFGNQPYLVYHHHDAAHQHIHIVSTNIQKDGKRISLHNLGSTISEKVRKDIEVKYGLVQATNKRNKQKEPLKEVKLQKALYGQVETKRAIANIVNQVISQYKFASLPELNAVLQQFNVIADPGVEGSRMFEKNGLQYCIINKKGEKVGVPIKASSIYNKPTLKFLESRFERNKQERQRLKLQVRDRIRHALNASRDKQGFEQALRQEKVDVVWRTNLDNFIYGVTYVDHQAKCAFNGSELGKELSAASIQEHWSKVETQTNHGAGVHQQHAELPSSSQLTISNSQEQNAIDILTSPSPSFDYIPYGLKKKRKKNYRRSR